MSPFLNTLFANQQYNKNNFFLLAGPCVVESEDLVFEVAEKVSLICKKLEIPFIFKASYRKANRTSASSFSGLGDEKALQMLQKVGKHFSLPTVTDIHAHEEAAMAANYVDVLQIPAFLCRQTDLLVAAAKTGKIVNVKKGQFLNGESMKFAVEKIKNEGNEKVMLTDRGNSFGYTDLIVDYRNIPIMQ
ncbi:MAG: 3-deoxy-8-phosphooctulonate synthase, partial [Ginsengibacter sp.]